MLRIEGAATTHAGQVRKTNQDRALFSPLVGAVADGMGGHQGGEQAAAITIEIFSNITEELSKDQLIQTVRAANKAVFDESERPELRGMGTTIVAAVLHASEHRVTMINVGDSRGYRLRNGELEQVTVDHSLVEELVRQGRITEDDALSHPQRNIVTRALGLGTDIEIDVFDLDAAHGDRLLLCSDGLFNEVSIDVIAERLRAVADPDQVAKELVELAVLGGGRDNISVVLLDVIDDEDPAAIRAAAEGARRPTPRAAATVFDTTVIEEVNGEPNESVHSDGDARPGGDVPPRYDIPPPPVNGASPEPAAVSEGFVTDEIEPVAAAPFADAPVIDAGHVDAVENDRSRARWVAVAVVATFLVAFLGINWFASSAYFAAAEAGEVVIFNGRPGGILWIDPEVEQRTGILVDDLAPAGEQKLEQELEWSSLDDAIDFVDQLERADQPSEGETNSSESEQPESEN